MKRFIFYRSNRIRFDLEKYVRNCILSENNVLGIVIVSSDRHNAATNSHDTRLTTTIVLVGEGEGVHRRVCADASVCYNCGEAG